MIFLPDLAVLADAAEVEALAGLPELDDSRPILVPVGDVVHAAQVEQLPRASAPPRPRCCAPRSGTGTRTGGIAK